MSAAAAVAKPPAEPIARNRTPTPNVSKGLSQNTVIRVFDGLQRVAACHEKAVIAAHPDEVINGEYHLRGWKWWAFVENARPRIVRKITKTAFISRWM